MRLNPPCGLHCENRKVGCQGKCEAYKAFSDKLKEQNAAKLKAYESGYALNAIDVKRFDRIKRMTNRK